MMKKLFLLPALCAMGAIGANAQSRVSTTSKAQATEGMRVALQPSMISGLTDYSRPTGTDPKPAEKTTIGGARWYSYAEYVNKLAPLDDSTYFPYLWHMGNAMGIYSDGSGGLIADTIQLSSYGIAFDPAFKSVAGSPSSLGGFNDISAGYDKSEIVVTRANNYTVDSVRVFGIYGRDLTKTTSKDTMRIAVVFGNGTSTSDMRNYFFSGTAGTFPRTAFGYDTVRFNALQYDKAANIAKGSSRIVKDIILGSTDTSLSNIKTFQVPVGLNVPAGNIVGVSVTFISGETYTTYKDTAFYGSARSSNPFGMGMVRPRMFAEPASFGTLSAPGYPRYYPGYYNHGFVKNLPESASWDTMYVPSYAYTAPFVNEIPDIDVKISCSGCNTIQELAIAEKSNLIADAKAFPNPANGELNVPFTLKAKANATVTITNMLGQVVATQNMGTVNAGQEVKATFNTANLNAGIYMYTVEVNGQRKSERFSVAH